MAGPDARARGTAFGPGGVRLHFETGGAPAGPPLLLIRGFARSASYWLDLRDDLEEDHRVVVFDNRGVGRSDAPRPGWSTADMAEDAAAVLTAAGVERADVFGISLGGMIAQWLALLHPDRVRRLVLASTSPGGRLAVPVPWRTALAIARSALAGPFEETVRRSARWALSDDFRARRPDVVETWGAIAAREPHSRAGLFGQLLAGARHDAVRYLRTLRPPTLVVTGTDDRMVPAANSRLLAERLPDARLRLLAGAGHDIGTERPRELAALIRAHLA